MARTYFEPLGGITTIADFAALCGHRRSGPSQTGELVTLGDFIARRRSEAHLAGDAPDRARITALVLAGEIDRAAACVEQHDREAEAQPGVEGARAHFDRLVEDLAATCAVYHEWEADLVKAMKLEHIWEPSRFPVEVPAPERNGAGAEPLFAITPWPARPPGLREEAPTQPGEVRFAEGYYWRGEILMLLAACAPEQAEEERHRAVEDYVIVVRLPDGRLLTVSHLSTFDRNDPDGPPRGHLDADFYIRLDRGEERIVAHVSSTFSPARAPGSHPDLQH